MLELKNLSFDVSAEGENKEIIRDVSLTIPDGMLVAVTGPNGGGKSTLARLIAGIERPSAGQILLNGEDITDLSITERARRGISYAFQQPVRFKGLRVKDLLSLATGKAYDTATACRYLSEVGLCARDYLDRELNDSLSGGEMTRRRIAQALDAPIRMYQQCASLSEWALTVAVQVGWIFILRAVGRAMWQKQLDNMIVQGG